MVQSTRRGHFQITDRGKSVLAENPTRIDVNYLSRFYEFNEFRERASSDVGPTKSPHVPLGTITVSDRTPEEEMRAAHRQLNETLGQEILERVRLSPPAFFEGLIVTLLVSMGYGGTTAEAGRAIGKSGDDGVDGVIDQDPLGLDRVYIQASAISRKIALAPGRSEIFSEV